MHDRYLWTCVSVCFYFFALLLSGHFFFVSAQLPWVTLWFLFMYFEILMKFAVPRHWEFFSLLCSSFPSNRDENTLVSRRIHHILWPRFRHTYPYPPIPEQLSIQYLDLHLYLKKMCTHTQAGIQYWDHPHSYLSST